MRDLRDQLERCFGGRVGLIGMGNVAAGDDGVGMRLADAIAARVGKAGDSFEIITVGTAPERYLGALKEKDFDFLLFLDAVEFGGQPGSAILLNAHEMAARFPQISTHKISLGLFARYVENSGKTKALLLGVQPESLQPSWKLTPTLQKTVESLVELICGILETSKERAKCEVRPLVSSPNDSIGDMVSYR